MLPSSRSIAAQLVLTGSAAGLLLCSCSAPAGAPAASGSTGAREAAQLTEPQLSISPSNGATAVPLDTPITVTASAGRLDSVQLLKAGTATPLPGDYSADGRTWHAAEGLDPRANYTVTASAVNGGTLRSSGHASFSTMSVQSRLITTISPEDGSRVGVGEPISLRFDDTIPPERRADLLRRITVESDPALIGAWHWFSANSVHFRPATYWQPGTKVTVTAKLKGFNVGDGTWGLGDWTSSFTVGDKHVAMIDDRTHTMNVYQNDQLIHSWPVSMGKAGFSTIQGTLIVLYHSYVVKMNSCTTFGGAACIPGSANYYNENVYYDTAISSDGYFIHAAPWSVYAQGHYDVSHGCVNLSTDRATTFYNWTLPGDVVVISNTGDPATSADGEGDWQIDFGQFANTPGVPAFSTGDSTSNRAI